MRILVVGNREVGKTTLMNRITTGQFEWHYIPTIHKEIYNIGEFDSVECINTDNFKEEHLDNYDAFIWIFDVCNTKTLDSIFEVYKYNDKPSIFVGSKYDTMTRSIRNFYNELIREKYPNSKIIYVSAKSCYNFEKAFVMCGVKFEYN